MHRFVSTEDFNTDKERFGMLQGKYISTIQKINSLLPATCRPKYQAAICSQCNYVNENDYNFCINCGYPIQNNQLVNVYRKRVQQRQNFLFKAENAVLVARVILYVMGAFLSLGIFFIFAKSNQKYIIVVMALLLSGLFFFLAFWSRRNPFTALLTSFIILIVFFAINIFERLSESFTTLEGITGMFICVALLFIVLKGVQSAYRISLINEELQIR
ncbi:MAG: zinc ribbon domain-containing protein [Parafilimonas sp.]